MNCMIAKVAKQVWLLNPEAHIEESNNGAARVFYQGAMGYFFGGKRFDASRTVSDFLRDSVDVKWFVQPEVLIPDRKEEHPCVFDGTWKKYTTSGLYVRAGRESVVLASQTGNPKTTWYHRWQQYGTNEDKLVYVGVSKLERKAHESAMELIEEFDKVVNQNYHSSRCPP